MTTKHAHHKDHHEHTKGIRRFPRLAEPTAANEPKDSDWPKLSQGALQGLAGDVVKLIGPQSESDPAALLIQFLTLFGNYVNRKPYCRVGATKHRANLFSLVVGRTSRSRKGTAFDHILAIFKEASAGWTEHCFVTGLSSGEGLIWSVRDQKQKTITERIDKRVLVYEPEFSRVLRVQRREGNILSTTLREAWDGKTMEILTKNAPAKATGAHVSMVGHITQDELRRELSTTDQRNGYANRFLFVCAKRSRKLAHGGNVEEKELTSLAKRVREARESARNIEELKRSKQADKEWEEWYDEVPDFPGMLGAITDRAEPQVVRLSMIYALLERSKIVRTRHLRAGLAVWSYCEASARYIFRTVVGDKNADRIYEALRRVGTKGMSKTDIRELFNRNLDEERTDQALELLRENRLAYCKQEPTAGRPVERWFALGV
jgi:hypothetical protein